MVIKKSGSLPRSKVNSGLMYGLGRLSQSGLIRAERQIREQYRRKKK